MPDISGHCAYVTGFHDDTTTWIAGVFVLDVPVNFVRQLNEPFVAIVAMNYRQHVFLTGHAADAGAGDGSEGGIPGDIGTCNMVKQVERMHLVFKAGFDLNIR